MKTTSASITFAALLAMATPASVADDYHDGDGRHDGNQGIQLGPRLFYLVDGLDDGPLKDKLRQCKAGPFYRTDFSIGHRGAALQFPEHTKESYDAGARIGAGIVECDMTFTRDGELVCRHSECDLHTTTNIVATDLNARCTVPWSGPNSNPKCCTSDLTLAEFKSLKGKMDASVPSATTPEGYLGGTASWRTDLYTGRGTLLTLRESIALNEKNGVKHTPELKGGDAARINQIFDSQAGYAQKAIDELIEAGVDPRNVWLRSFDRADVLYWVRRKCRLPDHHLDVRACRPAKRRFEGGVLLLLRRAGQGDQEGQRHVQGVGRARKKGENPRDLLRLAGHGHLLCELHGVAVELFVVICRWDLDGRAGSGVMFY